LGNTKHIISIIIVKRTEPYKIMGPKVHKAARGRISNSQPKSKLVRTHQTLKNCGDWPI